MCCFSPVYDVLPDTRDFIHIALQFSNQLRIKFLQRGMWAQFCRSRKYKKTHPAFAMMIIHLRFSLLCTLSIACICGANNAAEAQSSIVDTAASNNASTPAIGRPIFRIVAPQVICKSSGNGGGSGGSDDLPKQITITMQTPAGQRLQYRVRMDFQVLGGFRGQQHSLKLWDSVRKLEWRMNRKDSALIAEKNQINVNNSEVRG